MAKVEFGYSVAAGLPLQPYTAIAPVAAVYDRRLISTESSEL